MTSTPKKKFLFIHMGGTIGMKMTDNGLEPPENSDEYRSAILPAIETALPGVDFRFVSLSTVDSNDINPEALEELFSYIRAFEHEYDGILVTHGTDTLATTTAAFNTAFYGNHLQPLLNTPIVLTASQSSIHDTPTDGNANLLHSVHALDALSGSQDGNYYPLTAVVFRDSIINGAHVIKTSETKFDAFQPVSYQGLLGETASVGKYKLQWYNLPKDLGITAQERRAVLHGMLSTPLSRGKLLLSPLNQHCDTIDGGGFVHVTDIGTFGSSRSYRPQGNDKGCISILFKLSGIGNTGGKNYGPVSDIVRKYGIPFYGALSIPGGSANMHEYAAGQDAFKAGIVSGADISSAFAEVKLNWILANAQTRDTAPYVLRQMAYPCDLAHIFNFHGNMDQIPDIYETLPTQQDSSFSARLVESQSLVEAYRKFKGNSFRWLTVPQEQIRHAAEFLPRPDESKILSQHKALDFSELTGWSPF